MKKLTIKIGLSLAVSTLLFACHKDWTCTCVYPNSTTVVPYKDIPEKKAEDQCNSSAIIDSTSYSCSISKR